eukprot:6325700-Pyramimonas_sp.AAC.1
MQQSGVTFSDQRLRSGAGEGCGATCGPAAAPCGRLVTVRAVTTVEMHGLTPGRGRSSTSSF